jgi:hypothetical protein
MRAKAGLVLVSALLAGLLALRWIPEPAPGIVAEQIPTGHASQNYRTSQFAAHTGWMTFRELWFTYSGR